MPKHNSVAYQRFEDSVIKAFIKRHKLEPKWLDQRTKDVLSYEITELYFSGATRGEAGEAIDKLGYQETR